MEKLDWVDALRGYAVFGVICTHALIGQTDMLFPQFWGLGAKGVQLFYVMSAFTLLLSFFRRKERDGSAIANFFIRRFFRIAPMFFLAIVYYLFQDFGVVYPENPPPHVTSMDILSHFLLLHGLSPYWMNSVVPGGWSVGVEVMFYILCPVVLFKYITSTSKALLFYFATLVVGQLLYWLLLYNPLIACKQTWDLWLYTYLPTQLPVFILGFVAYFTAKEPARKALFHLLVLVIPCVALVGLNYLIPIKDFNLLNNMVVGTLFVVVVNVLCRFPVKIVVNPVFRFLGKISYSVYLVHFAVIHWLVQFDLTRFVADPTQNYLLRLLLILVLSSGISCLTYKYVEQPFQRYGKTLIAKRKARLSQNG